MNISLYDLVPNISTDDPNEPLTEDMDVMEYVNAQAFRANLYALVYRGNHLLANPVANLKYAMDDAFKFDNSNEPPRVRDALTMGAAQWPKCAGPEIFVLVQRPGDTELEQRRRDLGLVKEDMVEKEDGTKFLPGYPF